MENEAPEPEEIKRKLHDLGAAMEKVRTAQTERQDVVVDLKHAKLSRIELLVEDLKDVIKSAPENGDMFEFAVSQGETHRFWVDMTSFVRMGADGREYEFVKDTRLGRTILGRSMDREQVGELVTSYVAERILDRERAIEGDWIAAKTIFDEQNPSESPSTTENDSINPAETASEKKSGLSPLLGFIGGVLALAALGFAMIAYGDIEPIVNWVRSITSQG